MERPKARSISWRLGRPCAAFAALLVACGGAQTAPAPPFDLDAVVETFAPSAVPLGQALGVSYQIALADPAARARDLDRLAGLHAAVVRRDFTWAQLEPMPGELDFSAEDGAVADTGARGIATIGLIVYNAPWDAPPPDHDTATPPDPQKYAAFAEAAARHFAGRVLAWEIWNEENSGFRFWKPLADAAGYADLLAAAGPAVRRGDPNAKVLFGGLFYHGLGGLVQGAEDFIQTAYAHRPDLGGSYDVMALHPYPSYPPQAAPESGAGQERPLGLMLARVRAVLANLRDDKPVWVTEYGYPIYGSVDEPAQARFLVRGAIEAMAAGADRVCVFTLIDGPHPEAFPPEDAFGLVRNDGADKPAYGALSWLASIDPTARLAADESEGALRRYRFDGAERPFIVLWATDGQPHSASAMGSEVRDIAGNALKAAPAMLVVGADPIYVR